MEQGDGTARPKGKDGGTFRSLLDRLDQSLERGPERSVTPVPAQAPPRTGTAGGPRPGAGGDAGAAAEGKRPHLPPTGPDLLPPGRGPTIIPMTQSGRATPPLVTLRHVDPRTGLPTVELTPPSVPLPSLGNRRGGLADIGSGVIWASLLGAAVAALPALWLYSSWLEGQRTAALRAAADRAAAERVALPAPSEQARLVPAVDTAAPPLQHQVPSRGLDLDAIMAPTPAPVPPAPVPAAPVPSAPVQAVPASAEPTPVLSPPPRTVAEARPEPPGLPPGLTVRPTMAPPLAAPTAPSATTPQITTTQIPAPPAAAPSAPPQRDGLDDRSQALGSDPAPSAPRTAPPTRSLPPAERPFGLGAPPPSAAPPALQPAAVPPAQPAPTLPPVTGGSLVIDETTALIERGRLLARNGDIAAARLLFERAADARSGRAALLLGETYDPVVLQSMGTFGLRGDVAKARAWYARADELGVTEAADRLKALAGR